MLNPYALLSSALLEAMLRQPMFFVRQFYDRGLNNLNNTTIPLLFSHYSHHEIDRERAERHMQVIKNDRFRFLYDTMNVAHLEKLRTAAAQAPGYTVFTNVLLKQWDTPKYIKNNVGVYLRKKHLIDANSFNEKISIHLQDLFGKLYLRVSWRKNNLEVLLDEVENIYSNVL